MLGTGVHRNVRHRPLSHDVPNVDEPTESFDGSSCLENETANKWDQESSNALDRAIQVFDQGVGDASARADATTSSLHEELSMAKIRICELEAERRNTTKKLDRFLRNLAQEKVLRRGREHDKALRIVDAAKEDLVRERKNRQRLEVVNSKLVHELKEARSGAKLYLHDYEKERKACELMEEVCGELAKEIVDEKAEVEVLKSESAKMQEELEEERKMMQMAEVWREERVQMKLRDAKLALDYKYSQLSKLQAGLEALLCPESSQDMNTTVRTEAQRLAEAIASLKIQNAAIAFTYNPPPASEDIFAIYEEIKRDDRNERDAEQCREYGPPSPMIRAVSPDTDSVLKEQPMKGNSARPPAELEDGDNESGWETVSHIEEQGSSNSPDFCRGNAASVSGTDWDEDGKSCSELSEACSTTARKHREDGSLSRLRRTSISQEIQGAVPEFSNGRTSNVTLSPDLRSTAVSPQGVLKHNNDAKSFHPKLDDHRVELRRRGAKRKA